MSATQDFVALEWIRDELVNSLQKAQLALEKFAESAENLSSMRSCLTTIHQVHGTLKLVQLTGPILVAGEMEQLAQAMLNQSVSDPVAAQESLMRAIVQLPAYLDRLSREQKDSEEHCLPVVNDLRVARGLTVLPRLDDFTQSNPALVSALTLPPAEGVLDGFMKADGEVKLPKILAKYQVALTKIVTKRNTRENLITMAKLLRMLSRICGESPMGYLGELGWGLTEGIASGGIRVDKESAIAMRRIGAEIQRLVGDGSRGLNEPIDPDLGTSLMELIEGSSRATRQIAKLRDRYKSEGVVAANSAVAPDDEALAIATGILIEELTAVTDKLDLHVRSAERSPADLATLLPDLKKIASTLVLLGNEEQQEKVGEQIHSIEAIQGEEEADEGFLLGMAESLLQIQSSLRLLARNEGEEAFASLEDAQAAVIRETRNGLASCKDAVMAYLVAELDQDVLRSLPDELIRLRGGLILIKQQRAGAVLAAAAEFVASGLLAEQMQPVEPQLDTLADVLTSVDYYLERLLDDPGNPYLRILQVAEASIEQLGSRAQSQEPSAAIEEPSAESQEPSAESQEPSAESQEPSAAIEEPSVVAEETDVDEEIVAIFVEEVQEVLSGLDESLPAWRSNLGDKGALAEVRRAFHTLKGSGRMVGATIIGELAWSIENLLNSIIEGNLTAGPRTIELVTEVARQMPDAVEAFHEGNQHRFVADELISMAEALAEGRQTDHLQFGTTGVSQAEPDSEKTQSPDSSVATDVESSEGAEEDLSAEVEDWMEELGLEQTIGEAEAVISELETRFSDVAPVPGTTSEAVNNQLLLDQVFVTETLERLHEIDAWVSSDLRTPEGIITAFHALKGAAATAGVPSIMMIAASLEDLARGYLQHGINVDEQLLSWVTEALQLIRRVLADLDTCRHEVDGATEFLSGLAESLPWVFEVNFEFEPIRLLSHADIERVGWSERPALLGELAHTIEQAERLNLPELFSLAKALRRVYTEAPSRPGDEALELLQKSHNALLQMLDALASSQRLTDASELVSQMDALDVTSFGAEVPAQPRESSETAESLSASTEQDESLVVLDLPEDDIIDDLMSVFLEEAEELLEEIDEAIQGWMITGDASEHLDNLLRQLHTLKGGARMAGVASLSEFAHNFESFLIGVQSYPVDWDAGFFELLNAQQDEITRRVEIYRQLVNGDSSEADLASMRKAAIPSFSHPAGLDLDRHSVREDVDDPDIDVTRRPLEEPTDFQEVATSNQEMVRVSAGLVDDLIGLAGESSITRGRVEQQISDFGEALREMEQTINRIRDQVRRLEIEAESRETLIQTSRRKPSESSFDDLEMDRYTTLQAVSRVLNEATSDMQDLKDTLTNRGRDAETLLHQQSRISGELQEGLTRTQMVPFGRLIPRLRRIVRQVSGEVGKAVKFDVFNVEDELDRNILERIVAPLEHMLRNAVDHGIEASADRAAAGKPEQGRVELHFSREAGYFVLVISDDGRGIDLEAVRDKAVERGLMTAGQVLSDHELMQFIMHAGFSTAEKLTQISGRGVGMDVVMSEIKMLGGDVKIDSQLGIGSQFTIRIPFTVSINRALMAVVRDETYAIPLNTIEGIVRVSPYELEAYYQPDAPRFQYSGRPYRLAYMGRLLDRTANPDLAGQVVPLPVILARAGDDAVAIQVDRVIGSREVVVKALGSQFDDVSGVSGATVLGDGSIVIILDCLALLRGYDFEGGPVDSCHDEQQVEVDSGVRTVMIVDDSVTVRKVTSRLMERHGFEVLTAKDGVDAMEQLQETRPDIMLLDIEMPRMDGFEVLRSVRRDESMKELPIVMITSRTGDKHREQAIELGVDHYLGKPFQETNLMATIETILNQGNVGES